MTHPGSKKSITLFVISYLIVLGLALYFAKSMHTVHPAYYLVLALAGTGLIVGILFNLAFRSRAPQLSDNEALLPLACFQLIQGGLGFVLAYFLFNVSLKSSFAYPTGAVIGFIGWWGLSLRRPFNLSCLIFAGFLAGGLVIALRLQSVSGGLVYGLALLNSYLLGSTLIKKEEEAVHALWLRGLFFAALLVIGRAVIQFYLLKSNYASLGVVITHPYTYVALFAGIFLPALLWVFQRDKLLHPAFSLVLLGIIFPLILGIFIHVRPMAGYLLGLITSTFLFGILFAETYWMGLLSYLNMAAVAFGLPLFKALNNISRATRLEILGGVFVVALLTLLLSRLGSSKEPETA